MAWRPQDRPPGVDPVGLPPFEDVEAVAAASWRRQAEVAALLEVVDRDAFEVEAVQPAGVPFRVDQDQVGPFDPEVQLERAFQVDRQRQVVALGPQLGLAAAVVAVVVEFEVVDLAVVLAVVVVAVAAGVEPVQDQEGLVAVAALVSLAQANLRVAEVVPRKQNGKLNLVI